MNNLERFVIAQERDYKIALNEIKNGRKRSHWIWYIFPQLKGLGHSYNSEFYGIQDLDEAKNYLSHPVLGKRLIEITEALLALQENDPRIVMNGEIDAMKLKSCMTLFASVSGDENSIFKKVLEKFFGSDKNNS
ncbi:MAG: DUF1810 domain-containing protein [Synergistaceae bacterium]|nr:DUF1810 domain-containing protein [Synergistaceae bacterium]